MEKNQLTANDVNKLTKWKKMLMQNQKLKSKIVSRFNNYNNIINLIELNFIGSNKFLSLKARPCC